MLDLSYVRENLDLVAKKVAQRGGSLDVDKFRLLDLDRRRLLTEVEALKSRRNNASDEIGKRLSRKVFVKVIDLPDGKQPDQLAAEEIQRLVGGVG